MKKSILLSTTLLTCISFQTNTSTASSIHHISILNRGYAINVYNRNDGANAFMWQYSSSDPDQQWIWEGDKLKLKDTNLCLNAYNPHEYSNVNAYTCVTNDPEQDWDLIYIKGDYQSGHINLSGTSYCLNSYNPYNGRNLNLSECNESDPDQKFDIIWTLYSPKEFDD